MASADADMASVQTFAKFLRICPPCGWLPMLSGWNCTP
jgi:hypothetical protein